MAKAIWMVPTAMRAPHFPSTTAPRDIGEDASRRRIPRRRSMVSVTGAAGEQYQQREHHHGAGHRLFEAVGGAPFPRAADLNGKVRGSASSAAKRSAVGLRAAGTNGRQVGQHGVDGAGDPYLVETRVEFLARAREADLHRMPGEHRIGEAGGDFETAAVTEEFVRRLRADDVVAVRPSAAGSVDRPGSRR